MQRKEDKNYCSYLTRIVKLIAGVVWKVSERFRADIESELMVYAIDNRKKFENNNNSFVFVALRNKCTDLNKREIRFRNSHVVADCSLYETGLLEDDLYKVEVDRALSAASVALEQAGPTARSFIIDVIQRIWEDEQFPVKVSQKKFGMTNKNLYRMIKGIRIRYGKIKRNGNGQMYSVRTLEELKERMHSRKRQ